MTKNLH